MPLTREALVAHRTATAGEAPHRHVWFFHAHAYFEAEQEADARAFRDRIGAELAPGGHVQLNGIIGRPVGPHPTGNFEVLFTRDAFADVMTWLQFNRPVWMSVLVHPCTETMVPDHSDRAIWLGTPLPIDLKWPRIADEKARAENRDPVDVIDKDKAHRPT